MSYKRAPYLRTWHNYEEAMSEAGSKPGPWVDHIATLCRQHRIGLSFTAPGKEIAHIWKWDQPTDKRRPKRGRIEIAPITNANAYGAALHEIAHVVLEHNAQGTTTLQNESEAWQWAKQNAREWTPQMSADAWHAFSSYAANPHFPVDEGGRDAEHGSDGVERNRLAAKTAMALGVEFKGLAWQPPKSEAAE